MRNRSFSWQFYSRRHLTRTTSKRRRLHLLSLQKLTAQVEAKRKKKEMLKDQVQNMRRWFASLESFIPSTVRSAASLDSPNAPTETCPFLGIRDGSELYGPMDGFKWRANFALEGRVKGTFNASLHAERLYMGHTRALVDYRAGFVHRFLERQRHPQDRSRTELG